VQPHRGEAQEVVALGEAGDGRAHGAGSALGGEGRHAVHGHVVAGAVRGEVLDEEELALVAVRRRCPGPAQRLGHSQEERARVDLAKLPLEHLG